MSSYTVLDRRIICFNSRDNVIQNSNPSIFQCILEPFVYMLNVTNIPNTFYKYHMNSVTLKNDFWITNNSNSTFMWNGVQYSITQGIPTIEDIMNDLNTAGVTSSYSEDTNLITFHCVGELDLTDLHSCAYVIGLSRQVYNITDGFVCENDVSLGESKTLYILSNNVKTSFTVVNGETKNMNIMAMFSNIAPRYETLVFMDPDGSYGVFDRENRNLNVLRFTITDENFVALSLNSSWSASIVLELCVDYLPLIYDRLGDLATGIETLTGLEKRAQLLRHVEKQTEKKDKKKSSKKVKK